MTVVNWDYYRSCNGPAIIQSWKTLLSRGTGQVRGKTNIGSCFVIPHYYFNLSRARRQSDSYVNIIKQTKGPCNIWSWYCCVMPYFKRADLVLFSISSRGREAGSKSAKLWYTEWGRGRGGHRFHRIDTDFVWLVQTHTATGWLQLVLFLGFHPQNRILFLNIKCIQWGCF